MSYEELCGARALDFVKRYAVSRPAGSQEEKETAEAICRRITEYRAEAVSQAADVLSYAGEPETEGFSFSQTVVLSAALEVPSMSEKEGERIIPAAGYPGCRQTSSRVSGELFFVGDGDEIRLSAARDRIVMTGCLVRQELYGRIERAGAAAFVSVYGMPIDGEEDAAPCAVRLPALKNCRIPGIAVHYREALRLLEDGTGPVCVRLEETEERAASANVEARIGGMEDDGEGEFLALTAHYDSVPQGPGAYDNLAAVSILLELYRYFLRHRPRRSIRFVFFGAEEPGLLGSRHYVCAHEEELRRCLFDMNIDLAGQRIGQDVIGVTAEAEAAELLYKKLKEKGVGVIMKHAVWSSDSNSFAWKGVPAMTLDRDGFGMHTRHDAADLISAEALREQSVLMAVLADYLLNEEIFPLPRTIPEEMQKKLS
ncbi:M28 family metallopeptidase [Lachnoclostridium sp. Marseille-P6806]|uniref:M28 family metallopeptidase n=1 Tax=Lachnoclostridium sp. Marseille-P6806 TaxID=2364793 RepID=UPI001031575B|nr:M28 family metallopeptidase [Lachnoclostridium sp. Marseille-P6806]